MTLNEWIVNGKAGTSSKTIWAALKGIKANEGGKPYDPSDFGRCYKLVKDCNVSIEDLKKVSRLLPYWKPYIDNWAKLSIMYELNKKNNWTNSKKIGMYEFMRELEIGSDLISNNK